LSRNGEELAQATLSPKRNKGASKNCCISAAGWVKVVHKCTQEVQSDRRSFGMVGGLWAKVLHAFEDEPHALAARPSCILSNMEGSDPGHIVTSR
jgi:hypothetical protein